MSREAAGLPDEPGLDVPPEWENLPLDELRGVLMIIGAPNVGKSTFARYLFRRLNVEGIPAAYLDGDPGQSSLGPPATLTLACPDMGQVDWPPKGRYLRRFVGATTPSGHMLGVLVSAARLVEAASEMGAATVVYDTSGFIDPFRGGAALKLAKMDLLEPAAVFALQAEAELDGLMKPLRRSRRFQIFNLRASIAARRRDLTTRQAHRAEAFYRYFQDSHLLEINWPRYAVFPAPRFFPDRLAGLNDVQGFLLGLGIVRSVDPRLRQVELLTPLQSLAGVDSIHLGDLMVDPATFRDRLLERT